jgi:glucose-6-phosphate isomerase
VKGKVTSLANEKQSIALDKYAGFPVTLNEDGLIEFGPGSHAVKPEARHLSDMSTVLLYPSEAGPEVLYRMYRETGLSEDQKKIADEGLRYDITVIYPGEIGSEYVKTLGHYHPRVPGQKWTYPEVYQVLHGKAHFLLQRGGDVSGEVEDFIVADFGPGDILVIPPFYGHVTVNPGNEPLVMSNWIAREFSSVYDPIKLRKGLAYYDVNHKGESIFMPNDSYSNHPKPRVVEPANLPEFGLESGKSMYTTWKEGANLEFVVRPSVAEELWRSMGIG